jgi:hypothetical protein
MKNRGLTTRAYFEREGGDVTAFSSSESTRQGELVAKGYTVNEIIEALGNNPAPDTVTRLVGPAGLSSLGLPDPTRPSYVPTGVRTYSQIPQKFCLRSEDGRLVLFDEKDGSFVVGVSAHFKRNISTLDKRQESDQILPGEIRIFLDQNKRRFVLSVSNSSQLRQHEARYKIWGDLSLEEV